MKKWISLILAASCAVSIFAAVGCEQKTEEKPQEFVSALPVISDFESLDEVYARMSFKNRFGKVSLNEDKKYVTSGDRSLRLEVHGDYVPNSTPTLMQVNFTGLERENIPYVDLSCLESVQMDLFNETGAEQTLELALVIDGVTTDYQKVTAKAGENKLLTAEYDVKGLSVGSDMTKAEALVIKFPKAETMEANANLFYLDNLRFTFLDAPPAPIEVVLDENEFCSFDKAYQKYVVQAGGVGPTEGCQPILSINTDLQYCKDYTGRSLKAVLPRGTAPINDGWPYFTFIDKLMDQFDFVSLTEQNADFVFDVYNEGGAYNFGLEAWSDINGLKSGYSFTAKNGWTEVRVSMQEFLGVTKNEQMLAANVTQIVISYGKFDAPDKTFYFDNFRFEFPGKNN